MNDNQMHGHPAVAIEENAHMTTEKDLNKHNKNGEEKPDDYITKVKKQKKKWRPLNNNFFMFCLKFMTVLTMIEVAFVLNYILSKNFLLEVSFLTKELRLLISRQPQLEFLLLMEKELLVSNSTAQFL